MRLWRSLMENSANSGSKPILKNSLSTPFELLFVEFRKSSNALKYKSYRDR